MRQLHYSLLALVLVVGGTDWAVMILHRGYDCDEVTAAHSIWMVSQGLRPYHDFLECHPPYFALLAPLTRRITDPSLLLVTLRIVAAVGNLLFLASLITVAAMGEFSVRRISAILGTALVAFHPAVLEFLTEFRIDGWGYALAIWTIVWFLWSRQPWRHLGLGLGTGIATLLFCPKLALLTPIIVVFEQLIARNSLKKALWAFGTYALGLAVAAGLFWLWLAWNKIDVDLVFAEVVQYNSLDNFYSGFGNGLLQKIIQLWILSLPLLAAFIIWVVALIRTKSFPPTYLAALALWLLIQLVLISYIWKQYYAPWLLFASGFFPCLYFMLNAFSQRLANALFIGLCALSITASGMNASTWESSREAHDEGKLFEVLNEIANPEDRIVAPPPLHPIYRRDTFYIWLNILDPKCTTEDVMEKIPLVHNFVSERHYRDELEAFPPAIVVLVPDAYPPRQANVLLQFLREREYISSSIGNLPVAVRPDSYKHFVQTHPAP